MKIDVSPARQLKFWTQIPLIVGKTMSRITFKIELPCRRGAPFSNNLHCCFAYCICSAFKTHVVRNGAFRRPCRSECSSQFRTRRLRSQLIGCLIVFFQDLENGALPCRGAQLWAQNANGSLPGYLWGLPIEEPLLATASLGHIG